MGKKILIIAPHQDDELNILGPLIPFLVKKGFLIDILFVTNSDYDIKEREERIKETEKVAKYLKINEISFLGYPDHGLPRDKDENIYNSKNIYCSIHGRKTTSGPYGKEEYCFCKHKVHRPLTKESLLSDLTEFISEKSPDIIFATGTDNHPDHKIVSLILDESLNSIKKLYLPLVFKSFAYLGTWRGPNDYFDIIPKETIPVVDGKIINTFPYNWDDRISIDVPPKMYNVFYWRSPAYKAYRKYKTQNGRLKFFNCVNTDKCFWFKDLSNIATNSIISASSGSAHYLNDGKIIESNNIRNALSLDGHNSWTPSKNDQSKTIYVHLDRIVKMIKVCMYFDSSKRLKVAFKSSCTCDTFSLTPPFASFSLSFKKPINYFSLSFRENSSRFFVGEIEIFNDETNKRKDEFLSIFPKYSKKKRNPLMVYISKNIFLLRSILTKATLKLLRKK